MSDRPATRVRSAILAHAWAMLPESLETMLTIADRQNLTPEAVAAQLGRPLDNTHAVETRGPVAVIPVVGPISRYMSVFADISGGTSIDALATDLTEALANPGIGAILLAIDSPGGEVNGVAEFADMLYAARGQKPLAAYISDLGASAAYWIASACDEIVVASTALVGSIGVVMGVPNPAKDSGRYITFVSSQSPHKRPDPTTQTGAARLQSTVDALGDLFIGAVARNRGVDAATVATDFGAGDVLIGQAAVDAGLADRVGSFEGVVAELQQRAREPRPIGTSGRIAAQGGSMAEQTRMQRFMAWLGGEGDDSAFTEANIAAGGIVATAHPDTPTPQSQRDDPRLAAALAELDRLKAAEAERVAASLDADATAFAARIVGAGKALPVEADHLASLYRLAAADDAAHGAVTARDGTSTTRVAALAAWQEARPTGTLLGELVQVAATADGTLAVLDNPQTTEYASAAANDKPMTEEQRIQVMAMTATGRAELARRGIPIPVVPVQ